jgi:hypothetical protein
MIHHMMLRSGVYEVRPRKDKRGVDLVSDVLPFFVRLWYGGPSAISNAIGHAEHYSRSHDAVIRVCDAASNELFSRDFSDEKEIHSTATSSREHANTVRDRSPQRVRSSWFGGLLR